MGKRAKSNRKKRELQRASMFEGQDDDWSDCYEPEYYGQDEFDDYCPSDEYPFVKPWDNLTNIDHEDYHPDHPHHTHQLVEDESSHHETKMGEWLKYDNTVVKNVVVVFPFNLTESLEGRISSDVGIYHNQPRPTARTVDVMHLNINNTLEMFCSSLYADFDIIHLNCLVSFIQPRANILLKFLPPNICEMILMEFESEMWVDEVTLPLIQQLVRVYTGQTCRLL